MDSYNVLSPFFICLVMICAFTPGAFTKKNLGRSPKFPIKSCQLGKEGVNSFSPSEVVTKRKRDLQSARSNIDMECPKRKGRPSYFERYKCLQTFCQHISYTCNMQCREQDTGDVDCELHNCTGSHHCTSTNGLTIPIEEVCDDIDQCPDSDDESTCVRPCWPSCMCIGLIVNYRDTNVDISGFHFNSMFIITNNTDPKSVGASHLSYLSYLVITGIQTLPKSFLMGFNNLKSLNLSHNTIAFLSDGSFRDMFGLVTLNLASNMIDNISNNVFTGLSHLSSLDLRNNQINYLPDSIFSGLSSLTELYLSNNQIVDIRDILFNELSHLAYLGLNHNQIAVLPNNVFFNLPVLRYLDLGRNQIVILPNNVFYKLPALFYLNLSQNKIAILPGDFISGLTSLSELNLSTNHIKDLPDHVFSRLSNLVTLDLSLNQITVLTENVFSGLSSLNELYLQTNQIVTVPDDTFNRLPVIFVIRLNGNRLTTLPSLPVSLKVLDISYNFFVNLHFGSFINNSNISLLSVVGNDLEVRKSMFEGLDNLKTLLTDTPFMCCVKPKSVPENGCIKTSVSDLRMLGNCYEGHASCKSEVDAISSCDALIGSAIQRVCLWIIGICALLGNMIVFVYRFFIERDDLTQSYSLFVLNLCVSDFLMGVYLLIIGVADVYYNGVYAWNDREWRRSITCTIAGIVSTISSEMSTFLILLVTIDRVIAIAFPMSQRRISWERATIISVSLWFVSISLAIIPIVTMQSYFKGDYFSQSGVCLALPLTSDKRPGAEYSFSLFVCLNSFIFVVIVIGQICIFKSVITSGGRMTSSQTRQRDMSVARTLFMVVATDFCCWFPIGVMGVLSKSGYNIPDDAYAWVMVFVLPVNAAINPFLYTATAIWRKRQREKRRKEMMSPK